MKFDAVVVMCAGTFSKMPTSITYSVKNTSEYSVKNTSEAKAVAPVLKPFALAVNKLSSLGVRRVGLVIPIKEQVEDFSLRSTLNLTLTLTPILTSSPTLTLTQP